MSFIFCSKSRGEISAYSFFFLTKSAYKQMKRKTSFRLANTTDCRTLYSSRTYRSKEHIGRSIWIYCWLSFLSTKLPVSVCTLKSYRKRGVDILFWHEMRVLYLTVRSYSSTDISSNPLFTWLTMNIAAVISQWREDLFRIRFLSRCKDQHESPFFSIFVMSSSERQTFLSFQMTRLNIDYRVKLTNI